MLKSIICILAFLSYGMLTAKPSYVALYKAKYRYDAGCNACHTISGSSQLNAYGKDFKKNGAKLSAFQVMAALDSDGDGHKNDAESRAKSNPGDKKSTPSKPGSWLKLSNLIPKSVKTLFPKTQNWLVKDAIFTKGDKSKAKKMGVTLERKDENTIYIPLKGKSPAGIALIFPVVHQGKTFYLLMKTDKKLRIQKIKAVNTENLPSAKRSAVYTSLNGQQASSVEIKGSGLEKSIRKGIKKAGVIIYVRLKGA